jgi:hypothetical protein
MRDERHFMYAVNFHLRPSRAETFALAIFHDHFRWEGTAGWQKLPAVVTISIDGRQVAEKLRIDLFCGELLVPLEMVKDTKISILVENRSKSTRKWNMGQILLAGKVWDEPVQKP